MTDFDPDNMNPHGTAESLHEMGEYNEQRAGVPLPDAPPDAEPVEVELADMPDFESVELDPPGELDPIEAQESDDEVPSLPDAVSLPEPYEPQGGNALAPVADYLQTAFGTLTGQVNDLAEATREMAGQIAAELQRGNPDFEMEVELPGAVEPPEPLDTGDGTEGDAQVGQYIQAALTPIVEALNAVIEATGKLAERTAGGADPAVWEQVNAAFSAHQERLGAIGQAVRKVAEQAKGAVEANRKSVESLAAAAKAGGADPEARHAIREVLGAMTIQNGLVPPVPAPYDEEMAGAFADIGSDLDRVGPLRFTGGGLARVSSHAGGTQIHVSEPPRHDEGVLNEIYWAHTTELWEDNSEGSTASYVLANPCDDILGNGVDTDTELTIYLPDMRTDADFVNQPTLPNVPKGAVIAYTRSGDGTLVCVSSYMDAAKGSIRLWSQAYEGAPNDIPAGWALADGEKHCRSCGEAFGAGAVCAICGDAFGTTTTKDLSGRFVVGWVDGGLPADDERGDKNNYGFMGSDGGTYEHDHDDHAEHFHSTYMTLSSLSNRSVPDAGPYSVIIDIGGWYESAGVIRSGSPAALEHTTENHRPPWYVLAYIERMPGQDAP